MQHLSILSCKLPTGENVYCGVTLEPYTLLKRGDQTVTVDDLPEEGTQDASAVHQLRMRWYRSTVPRGGAVCSVHPDREASMQCMVCLRHRVAQHLSYHCSVDCLKSHWHLHKDYHKQQPNPSIGENGYDGISKGTSTNVDSWVEVGRGKTYTPCTDDVGYVLKFEISVVDRLHPYADHAGRTAVAVTARVRPTPNPPARQLVQMVPMSSQHAAGRFTILSYNLLADLYAKADFASTCPAWCLHWHYRKRNLLRELLAYRADILCLQEVQSDHYTEYWAPELQKVGYIAIYKKKTTEIYTDNKYAIDGCATFFRKDRFQLVKKYEVEFNKAALSLAESFTNLQQKKAALNRLLKDNVALIAVLEAIEPGPSESGSRRTLICVANTHIHANPELNDVKLWQVHTLLKGLEKIAASADIPMLVAGDFNSLPGSPAHTLLVNGKVDPAAVHNIDPLGFLKDQKLSHSPLTRTSPLALHPIRSRRPTTVSNAHTARSHQPPCNMCCPTGASCCATACQCKLWPLHAKLPLLSAYAAMSDAHGAADARLQKQKQRVDPKYREPLFSIVTKEFRGTLDYILYTKNSLQPTAVLELPCESDLLTRPDEHLPNAQYSSDHIALLAEFQYLRN